MGKVTVGLICAAVLVLAGCFDYEETLTMNPDGSGTMELHYTIYFDMLNQFAEDAGEQIADPQEFGPTQEDFENAVGLSKGGLKLLAFERAATESTSSFRAKLSFEDVSAFAALSETMGATSGLPREEDEPEVVFYKQADGSWLFERRGESMGTNPFDFGEPQPAEDLFDPEAYSEEDAEEDTEEDTEGVDTEDPDSSGETDLDSMFAELSRKMEQLQAELAKRTIKYTVKFPGKVVESNATRVEGNAAIWEFKLSDGIDKMPEKFRAVVK